MTVYKIIHNAVSLNQYVVNISLAFILYNILYHHQVLIKSCIAGKFQSDDNGQAPLNACLTVKWRLSVLPKINTTFKPDTNPGTQKTINDSFSHTGYMK